MIGINFSYKKSDELKYKKVYKELEKNYVIDLKRNGLTDSSIPKKVWNKYHIIPFLGIWE